MVCNCLIETLLKTPFSQKDFSTKMAVIQEGRPTSDLPNLITITKHCVRRFSNNNYYEKMKWLTGCNDINAVFCWPCLLFAKEKTVWNCSGFKDMNNFYKATKRHEQSQNHLQNIIQLNTFGKTRIENAIDVSRNSAIVQYNEKVKKNRKHLEFLIDSVCFLGIQGLAFRGNNENQDSFNRGK